MKKADNLVGLWADLLDEQRAAKSAVWMVEQWA